MLPGTDFGTNKRHDLLGSRSLSETTPDVHKRAILRKMMTVLLIVALICACTSAAEVGLTLLTDEKAKCLDGTQAGFYYQAASLPESQTKWVIYLNGGGECDSKDSCVEATTNKLGSSKYFMSTEDRHRDGSLQVTTANIITTFVNLITCTIQKARKSIFHPLSAEIWGMKQTRVISQCRFYSSSNITQHYQVQYL